MKIFIYLLTYEWRDECKEIYTNLKCYMYMWINSEDLDYQDLCLNHVSISQAFYYARDGKKGLVTNATMMILLLSLGEK